MEDCKSCLFLKKAPKFTVWEGDRNYLWSKLVNKISFTFSHPLFPLGFSYNKKDNDLLERKKRAIFLEAEFKSIWQKNERENVSWKRYCEKVAHKYISKCKSLAKWCRKVFFLQKSSSCWKYCVVNISTTSSKAAAKINKNTRFTSDAVSNLLA